LFNELDKETKRAAFAEPAIWSGCGAREVPILSGEEVGVAVMI
jgi:hypothetical protein